MGRLCHHCEQEKDNFDMDMFICNDCVEEILHTKEKEEEQIKVPTRRECLDLIEEILEMYELFGDFTTRINEVSEYQEGIIKIDLLDISKSIKNRCEQLQELTTKVEDYVYESKQSN